MTDILKLSELTTVIARGISPKYTEGDGVMVLNQRCVRDQTISYENHRRNDVALRNVSSQKSLKPFDILVNSTGVGTLGRVAQIKTLSEPIITVDSHVTIVRPDPERISPRFLGFSVRGNQKIIEEMAEGATGQTELSRTRLGELMIYVPLLPTQKKIASILSAYDDLIENNNRRIQILEEMAQRIYREWFVRFRFPGHENVNMVDSELGRIPQGWEVKKFDDVAESVRNGIKPYDYPEEKFNHYSLPAYDTGQFPTCEFGKEINSNKYLVETGCVLYSKLNPKIKRVWLPRISNSLRPVASTEFLMLRPTNCMNLETLYAMIQSDYFLNRLKSGVNGTSTSHQRLQPTQVLNSKWVFSPPELMVSYSAILKPINEEIFSLQLKNQALRKTRDLLLPRLISGRLDVENLDIAG